MDTPDATTEQVFYPMEGLIAGCTVHYVPEAAEETGHAGEHLAAIVSQVLDPVSGNVVLHVFLPDEIDQEIVRVRGRMYSTKPLPGTWHWVEST